MSTREGMFLGGRPEPITSGAVELGRPHVALGIAFYGHQPTFATANLIPWVVGEMVAGALEMLVFKDDLYIGAARNEIVQDFLNTDGTHLLFLDQDVILPSGAIRQLVLHRRPVVGALYYYRTWPHLPVAGTWKPDVPDGWESLPEVDPNGGLQRVDVVGMGATLIRRDVFESIGEGWFDMNARGRGEDLAFCRRVADAGFAIWLDSAMPTMHIGTAPITGDHYIAARGLQAAKDYAANLAAEGGSDVLDRP